MSTTLIDFIFLIIVKKRLSNDLVKLVLSLCFFFFSWLKPVFIYICFLFELKFKKEKNLLVSKSLS